ncbi:MAG: RnfABCDGE type electron transport complex subunit C [Gammaproteobacteria bacterium]
MFGGRRAFPGGITLPRRESRAPDLPIRQLAFAPLLSLPLRQDAGGELKAVVREGEEVVRGQLLARAGSETGAALHAPATGRVVRLVEQPDSAGGTVAVLELEPFPGDTQEYPGSPGPEPETLDPARIVSDIRAAGIVGMGGARRPTHARLHLPPGEQIKLLVLNGIEVEHVFSRVPALLQAEADSLLLGARYLLRAMGAARAVLAVEEQDAALARAMVAAAPEGMPLALRALTPRYPQGAEELLLRVLSGAGRGASTSALQQGARCFNLATVAEVGRLLSNGQCMTDQVITLAGSALREPGNYRVPLGTPVRFALEYAGLGPNPARVLAGGPMRGTALASLDVPITKGVPGLLALDQQAAGALEPPLPCIRCGECVAVCPLQLQPAQLGLLARKGEIKVMHEEYYLDACFECGCCSYVCPSHIPLVQMFRAAKAQWRRRQPAAAGEVAA